jgi:hypothetical protein
MDQRDAPESVKGGLQHVKRMERFLYSVVHALEVEAAMSSHQCCGDFYMNRSNDPLLTLRKTTKEWQEEGGAS